MATTPFVQSCGSSEVSLANKLQELIQQLKKFKSDLESPDLAADPCGDPLAQVKLGVSLLGGISESYLALQSLERRQTGKAINVHEGVKGVTNSTTLDPVSLKKSKISDSERGQRPETEVSTIDKFALRVQSYSAKLSAELGLSPDRSAGEASKPMMLDKSASSRVIRNSLWQK